MPEIIESVDLKEVLKKASLVFRSAARRTKILASLSWNQSIAEDFFKNGTNKLPKVEYQIDRPELAKVVEELAALGGSLKGDHPVLKWLSEVHRSFIRGTELLMAVESDAFFQISTQLYGNSKSCPFEGQVSNIDLARSLAARLPASAGEAPGLGPVQWDAAEFAQRLTRRLDRRRPEFNVKVEITPDIVARVISGMSKVRVRQDALFTPADLDALWNHEIETHCLTAHNGDKQPHANFLVAGGPRSTLTQEGLAVFYEIFDHTMSQKRFLILCDRIEAVAMVEAGADFIQLYRWYRERMPSEMEAFYCAQRIFRGTRLNGGQPFTKDVVYLAGLLGVYNFLRLAVKDQNRVLVESLACGRVAIEDLGTIAWMRGQGLISAPKYTPGWLENWEALLSFFSFSALLQNVDLSLFHSYFERHFKLQDWDLT